MKHLKTYKIFESHDDVDTNILRDILIEINDEEFWKTDFWKESQFYVVIIETIYEDEEQSEGLTPPPVVIETIKEVINYMNGEGFTNHRITLEEEASDSIISFDSPPDDLDELSDLEVWSNNFIRIEFWK
jgi:hypothetical protein